MFGFDLFKAREFQSYCRPTNSENKQPFKFVSFQNNTTEKPLVNVAGYLPAAGYSSDSAVGHLAAAGNLPDKLKSDVFDNNHKISAKMDHLLKLLLLMRSWIFQICGKKTNISKTVQDRVGFNNYKRLPWKKTIQQRVIMAIKSCSSVIWIC